MIEIAIDYNSVKAEDLEFRREPRKSKFSVVHRPSGEVAENPVAPGTHAEVRYRRPTGMPKENRPKNMTGFIEARGEGGNIWPIIQKDDEPEDNQYLTALAGDSEALKASFEGKPETSTDSGGEASQVQSGEADNSGEAAAAAAAEAAGNEAPPADTPAPEADATETSDETKQELDDLLAGLEN